MNFYYCLDLSRAGTRTHEKVSNWLKTGHENHQTRSTGTRRREPAPAYILRCYCIYKTLGLLGILLKVNPVEAETTGSNESNNFLPVVSEADLSTGPP